MTGNKIEDLILPEVEKLGFECVLLEIVGSSRNPVIRLFIDKPDGVKVKDCGLVSRTVGLLLEQEDPIPGKYLLEVSSPGSNRPLVTEAHFQRFAGEVARVQQDGEEGKVTHTGTIVSCMDGILTISTSNGEMQIPFSEVLKAHLTQQEYKIDKKQKKEKRARRKNKREGEK